MSEFRVGEGIKWRKWDDGIGVFVAATCETYVLSPLLLPIFLGDSAALEELAMATSVALNSNESSEQRLGQLAKRLCELKILDLTD